MKHVKINPHRLIHALITLLTMLAFLCVLSGDYTSAAGLFIYAASFSVLAIQ